MAPLEFISDCRQCCDCAQKENKPSDSSLGQGSQERSSPGGTTGITALGSAQRAFFRPRGTSGPPALSPAINRWAIFGRPCGTLARRPGGSGPSVGAKDRLHSTENSEEPLF